MFLLLPLQACYAVTRHHLSLRASLIASSPPDILLGSLQPSPYSDDDLLRICAYFSSNLQESGAVAASPSRSEPDYWYHWTRDAAITMAQLMDVLEDSTCESTPLWQPAVLYGRLRAYVEEWVPKAQFANDPNGGFDIRGEPKWFMDGRVYNGPWGRLQNDGPALRALVLTRYASQLLQKGDAAGAQVKQALFRAIAGCPFSVRSALHFGCCE
jgi:glucoamylase